MPIQVDAYTTGGMASGRDRARGAPARRPRADRRAALERVRWQPLDGAAAQPAGDSRSPSTTSSSRSTDDEPAIPVHASWHALRLEVGPYVVEGELPTLPGYDPGRALARPTGEFVLLRDVRASARDRATRVGRSAATRSSTATASSGSRPTSCSGFFFPGAALDGSTTGRTAGGAAPTGARRRVGVDRRRPAGRPRPP